MLAPMGRDAALLCETLGQAGLKSTVCPKADLQAQLSIGVGVVLLSEEALTPETVAVLRTVTQTQPEWSDLPLVLLVNESWKSLNTLIFKSPVTVLERPTRIPTLVTVVRAALIARRRQYQVRDLLRQKEDVNVQLEARVANRTTKLRTANAQLKNEIAEHKEAKQDLLESERRFEKAFRVGPVAASITTLADGRFIDINESFESLTGYSREETVGKTDRALAMWASEDDQARMTAALQESVSYHELELHIRTKEGETLSILASAEAVNVDNTPCLLHMFYDITERKQNEEEMLQAINEVMQDAAWFSRSLMEKLAQARVKRAGNTDHRNGVAKLTKREKQVLEHMARGRSNAFIAAELGLAEQTIRNYITNLYEKIDVHSRAEAVVWARERGLASS